MHVAIILDGNRRFAKKKKMNKFLGHYYGAEKVEKLIKWCKELDVNELTLYTFSIENFKRLKNEKKVLFKLFRVKVKKLKKESLENKIQINFIGRLEMFPKDIQKSMMEIMLETRKFKKNIINFAMAYGGRQEIVDACKKIITLKIPSSKVNEKMISKHLYLPRDPDLIIRPGGEKRVSNFLIWQGSYSEYYFTDKLWPEFTKADFKTCLNTYKLRERRYGR